MAPFTANNINSSILNLRLFPNAILVRTAKCKAIIDEVFSEKYREQKGPDE